MDASHGSLPQPRLWPHEEALPDSRECLMIYKYLDCKTGKPARVYPDESQAAKDSIFRDYLRTTLEITTDNYNNLITKRESNNDKHNRSKEKTLSTQSIRTRQIKWHLPTKPREKVEFVKRIRIGLQKYRANGVFDPPNVVDAQSASFVAGVQPPEADTPSTTMDFNTPEPIRFEHFEPSAGYLGAPTTQNTPAILKDQALLMPPPEYPPRRHGANSSLGVKDKYAASVDEGFQDGMNHRVSMSSIQTNQKKDSGFYSKHNSLQSVASFNNMPVMQFQQQVPFQPDQDAMMAEITSEKLIMDQLPSDSVLQETSPQKSRVEEETVESTTKVLDHDPSSGQWFGRLQTLPCNEFHTYLRWDLFKEVCTTCGFSKAHSLPIHGHKMDADSYEKEFLKIIDEIFNAREPNPPLIYDGLGNTPLLFAAAAGLTFEHLNRMFSIFKDQIYTTNVLGQNFFHVLDPVHIGDKLSRLLRWFEGNKPGFIFERDVYGRTVLQSLLRQPLSPNVMKEVLLVFSEGPGGIRHQLQILDSFGNNASWLANILGNHNVILDNVNDIQYGQVGGEQNQIQFSKHLLHNIISTDQPLPICPACGGTEFESAGRLHQIECAIRAGAGENDYNESGHTPLQVLVSTPRHEDSGLPEPCAVTLRLVKQLLSCAASPHTLLEARSREGKTALYMAAERGNFLLVEHFLSADPTRKRAMANVRACNAISVLSATTEAYQEAAQHNNEDMKNRYLEVYTLLSDAGGLAVSSDAAEWAL